MSRDYVWIAWLGLGAILLLITGQVFFLLELNSWYGNFYDLLPAVFGKPEKATELWDAILIFCYIATPYIILGAVADFLTKHYTFSWRRALTFYFTKKWRNNFVYIEGASQRIQEDCYRCAHTLGNLGTGLFRAVLVLFLFTNVLWTITYQKKLVTQEEFDALTSVTGVEKIIITKVENVKDNKLMKKITIKKEVEIGGRKIPGFFFWVAALTALLGTGLSFVIGRKLPRLEYENQKTEAAFRKTLVLVEDNPSYGKEEVFKEQFKDIAQNYGRLFLNTFYFDNWKWTYNVFNNILPIIIAAPTAIFTGLITFGVLQQLLNCFDKINSSLSFFIDNWLGVTELQSVFLRLKEFERKLSKK